MAQLNITLDQEEILALLSKKIMMELSESCSKHA